jgi:hypothetical protein
MRQLAQLGIVACLVVGTPAFAQSPQEDNPIAPWRAELEKKPTPRGPDGKPVLEGVWQRSGPGSHALLGNIAKFTENDVKNPDKTIELTGRGEGAESFINFERDNGVSLGAHSNKPLYKPQFWAEVQRREERSNFEDPTFVCMPMGVPRMGPPSRIVRVSPTEWLFLNQGLYYDGHTIRVIKLDKPHPPESEWEGISWLGKPAARWDGDTLVVESVDFGDQSWLDVAGYFHSVNMKVTERFTRVGDTIRWDVTVEDPEMFLQPWVWNPWYVRVDPNPQADIVEEQPCRDTSREHTVTNERG